MAFRNAFASAAFGFFLACPGVAPLHAAEPAALTQAVLAGDAAQVRAALAAGGSPGTVDPEVGHSALYLAVAEGGPRDAAILDLLLARKPDLDAEDAQSKTTPLTAAMVVTQQGPFASIERSKATVLVERLLKAGASATRATSGGDTPLLVAVGANNLEVVKLLLARGANPSLRTGGKASVLQLANASGRSKEMLDALRAAAPPVVAARGAGADAPSPEDAENAPVPEKSSISGWFIGGAAIAAAGVIAALVANQKRKNAANQTQQQAAAPQPIPQPQPVPQPIPQPTPQPVPQPTPQPIPQPVPQPVPQPQPIPAPVGGPVPQFVPATMSSVPQLQIVGASFFPPVPQFGQPYAVRISLKNTSGTIFDGSDWRITSNARNRQIGPNIRISVGAFQQVEFESPGFLFDGRDSRLTITSAGQVSDSRMVPGVSYAAQISQGTLTLPPPSGPVPPAQPPGDPTVRLKVTGVKLVPQSGQAQDLVGSRYDSSFRLVNYNTPAVFPPGTAGQTFVLSTVLRNESTLVLGAALWGVLDGDRLLYAERLNIGPSGAVTVNSAPLLYDGNPKTLTVFATGAGVAGEVNGASVRTAPDILLQPVRFQESLPRGPLQPNDRPVFTQTVDACLQVSAQSSDACPAPWYFGVQVANKCNDRRLIETCSLRDGWGQCITTLVQAGGVVNTPSCGQPGASGYRIRSAEPALQNGVVVYALPPMLYGPSMQSRPGWPR